MKSTKETEPARRVLFIGNPDPFTEVSQWAMLKQWAAEHGMEQARDPDADLLFVIATEDVLDGVCSPSEAMAVQRARADGVPCISAEHVISFVDAATCDTPADVLDAISSTQDSPAHTSRESLYSRSV